MSKRVIRRLAGVFFAGLMAVGAVSLTQVDQPEQETQEQEAFHRGFGVWS